MPPQQRQAKNHGGAKTVRGRKESSMWSVSATGAEVAKVIRENFGQDAFRVRKESNGLSFAVRSAAARAGKVRSKLGGEPLDSIEMPSALSRLEAAGVVGRVRSNIPDLAINPDHMEGFGGG